MLAPTGNETQTQGESLRYFPDQSLGPASLADPRPPAPAQTAAWPLTALSRIGLTWKPEPVTATLHHALY